MAGIIISVRNVELIIPPIIGAAILCITSLPTPFIYIIGIHPPKIVNKVINFGLSLKTAPL